MDAKLFSFSSRQPRPRIIPVLLLAGRNLLYKTKKFKDPKYVGDPRIAVKIFNDKSADEIILLDITARTEKRTPNFQAIEEIVGEAFMPVAYGGGVSSLDDAKRLFSIGIEKIILNTCAVESPKLISDIRDYSGEQSIVISIDAKRSIFSGWNTYTHCGKKSTKINPIELAKRVELLGIGEIMINSIDRDGTMIGYDSDLCRSVAEAVSVPVIACGGAGNLLDCAKVIYETGAAAAAAGSIFVFHGPHRAVLIQFPEEDELESLFSKQG